MSDVAAGCDCFTKVNKLLREHNTVVKLCDTISMKTGNFERRMVVPTERADPKKRKGPMKLFATYCPMCGKKYPKDDGSQADGSGSA